MIKIIPITAFSDNYIWCLYDDQSRKAVVVDPGDAPPVLAVLADMGLSLEAIIITHHHFDHTGGVDALLTAQNSKLAVYGPNNPAIKQISSPLDDNNTVTLLGLKFTVITLPGHTLDHIAFYNAEGLSNPVLFCGDTLFAGGCGRVFEGTPSMMQSSLAKLAVLPTSTKVYCAHEYTMSNLKFASAVEPDNNLLQQRVITDTQKRNEGKPTVPSTIGIELATNPFLRCDNKQVIAAALQQSSNVENSTAVFAAIRNWKDNF